MAWTRIDDKFLNNIKVQKAGALGMALYLAGLIHCNTNLTDGFIDEEILPMLYGLSYQSARNKSVDKLVELKLWHKVNGGYEINDFLDFNRSKSQIETIKEKRSESGSKGGSILRAKDKQIAKQNAKQNAKQTLEQNSSINTLSPKPIKDSLSDTGQFDDFYNAFCEETNLKPRATKEQTQAILDLEQLGVSVEEYREAIREMLVKGYKCSNLASPYNWIVNKRNEAKAKPETKIYTDPYGNEVEVAI